MIAKRGDVLVLQSSVLNPERRRYRVVGNGNTFDIPARRSASTIPRGEASPPTRGVLDMASKKSGWSTSADVKYNETADAVHSAKDKPTKQAGSLGHSVSDLSEAAPLHSKLVTGKNPSGLD